MVAAKLLRAASDYDPARDSDAGDNLDRRDGGPGGVGVRR